MVLFANDTTIIKLENNDPNTHENNVNFVLAKIITGLTNNNLTKFRKKLKLCIFIRS